MARAGRLEEGMSDRLLTIPEGCRKMSTSRSVMYRMFNDGRLTPVKIGRSTRVAESDVDALIESLKAAAKE